jgi:hypothetical protein
VPDEAIYNELVLLQPPVEGMRRWETTISPTLANGGYKLTTREAQSLHYVKRYAPGWTIAVAILLFPVGLLALMAKNESMLIVTFEAYGSGTLTRISGTGSRKNKQWLDGLTEEMNQQASEQSASSAGQASQLDRLGQLWSLRDRGMISEEQFIQERDRLRVSEPD